LRVKRTWLIVENAAKTKTSADPSKRKRLS
jgi:hypothetical protein